MTREEVEKIFEEFAATLDGHVENEWYATDYDIWSEFVERFIHWRFGLDIEREARRSMYLALKKEFEGEA